MVQVTARTNASDTMAMVRVAMGVPLMVMLVMPNFRDVQSLILLWSYKASWGGESVLRGLRICIGVWFDGTVPLVE